MASKTPYAEIISNTTTAIELTKTPYASLSYLIPPVGNRTLVFEIKNANCQLANAIRRTLMSEMPIKHLTASLVDIKTTDPYIVAEAILKRLEMIPISQSVHEDAKFSLRTENNSNRYADVLSSEIKLNGVATSKHITPSIPICDINSGCSFSINDISVKESYGYANARVSIGRIAYEIIGTDFNQPPTNSVPTNFHLEIETPGIIDPVEMVRKAIDNLFARLAAIDYDQSTVIEFNMSKLTILNETHTIGRLVSWYMYQIDPTIEYVACRTLHPSKRECVIDIRHPDSSSLYRQAVAAIKDDLAALRIAFV
jgi:DNA-directed RNA polymerase subunit L